MFKVSGASVYPSEVEKALRGIPASRRRTSPMCRSTVHSRSAPRSSATQPPPRSNNCGPLRAALSSFKVPTVWLLVDSDDDIPRGGTGKVDVRRLRELLAGQA